MVPNRRSTCASARPEEDEREDEDGRPAELPEVTADDVDEGGWTLDDLGAASLTALPENAAVDVDEGGEALDDLEGGSLIEPVAGSSLEVGRVPRVEPGTNPDVGCTWLLDEKATAPEVAGPVGAFGSPVEDARLPLYISLPSGSSAPLVQATAATPSSSPII